MKKEKVTYLDEVIAGEILEKLELLSNIEREGVFDKLSDKYCLHCGRELYKKRCHCENEE